MKLSFLVFFILFSSCAQRIKVPVNRMNTSEVLGKGMELEYRQMGLSEGKLDFTDNRTDNALIMSTVSEEELYIGFGLSRRVDLFVRVPKQSSTLVGLKIQVFGTPSSERSPGNQLAFTLATGSARDTFEQSFKIKLKSDIRDYSIIHGYRLNEYILFYDGLSLSHYDFEGSISGAVGLSSDELNYSAKNILGAHIGVELGGASFKMKLESAAQKILWTNTEEKLLYTFAYSLSAVF